MFEILDILSRKLYDEIDIELSIIRIIFRRFHAVYSGTGVSYKIAKLSENKCYKVRLFASNDAGQGPYSQLYEFKTAYAHPPPLKGKIQYSDKYFSTSTYK